MWQGEDGSKTEIFGDFLDFVHVKMVDVAERGTLSAK